MDPATRIGSALESTAANVAIGAALTRLQGVVAAVNRSGEGNTEFDQALVLKTLSDKEGIPIAIVGGLGTIKHGYERYTQNIDIVVAQLQLDTIIRVAPRYGIKVIWQDPRGWHKLQYAGIKIEVVPEGGKASRDAPTTIPGPKQLGVTQGMEYATLEGWMETKLSSVRRQDQADVVQVLKKAAPESIEKVWEHVASVHPVYLRLFEELVTAANEEKQQEAERGGPR